MASSSDLFPLNTLADVEKFFAAQMDSCSDGDATSSPDPDLGLLSIVVGALEHAWTASKNAPVMDNTDSAPPPASSTAVLNSTEMRVEPPLEWHVVDALYTKFRSIIEGFCDPALLAAARNAPGDGVAVRPLVKHVADIVWNTLTKGQYKDRPHIQSIYSYLTGNKLDCFGVAFAVVAACQLLKVPDVHLALSEDHAWVVFGAEGTETAEVTWHGKGNEDKRGQPVDIAKAKTSWLYVAGQPVVCDRFTEVAAMVSSINYAITANIDSIECGTMQQQLLWILNDRGHLKNYPMALANLGDCEEISPTLGRPPCHKIFQEAISVNKNVFDNHHVYPYTYQAGYYYRTKQFKKALEGWAAAADVIKLYKYSKDDEEIYKEFLEIANELIPHTVRTASLNPQTYREVLQDPECFSHVLRFYDGICSWEEDSLTPVLHIGWAKPMVTTCSKFDAEVRTKLDIPREESEESSGDEDTASKEGMRRSGPKSGEIQKVPEVMKEEEEEEVVVNDSGDRGLLNNNIYFKDGKPVPGEGGEVSGNTISPSTSSAIRECDKVVFDNSNENSQCKEVNDCKGGKTTTMTAIREDTKSELIQSLADGAGENVLSFEFLLGRRDTSPFHAACGADLKLLRRRRRIWKKRRRLAVLKRRLDKQSSHRQNRNPGNSNVVSGSSSPSRERPPPQARVSMRLHSVKMRGLKGLLCAEKLNTSAIQLQLTAQSQTEVKKGKTGEDDFGGSGRPKRARRD